MGVLIAASFFLNLLTIGFGSWKLILWTRKPKTDPVPDISDLVNQVADSLRHDTGWSYTPPDKILNTADCWYNKNLDLTFSTSLLLKDGPKIYRFVGKVCQDIEALNTDEISLIQRTLAERELSQLMSKRLDLLDKTILDLDETTKVLDEATKIEKTQPQVQARKSKKK